MMSLGLSQLVLEKDSFTNWKYGVEKIVAFTRQRGANVTCYYIALRTGKSGYLVINPSSIKSLECHFKEP